MRGSQNSSSDEQVALSDTRSNEYLEVENPKKRSFLLGLGALIGAAGAANLLGGGGLSVAMAYQGNPQSWQSAGRLFTQKQMQQLRDICQLVIPKTDTAGAGDVDTHGFIDNQLVRCHANWQQTQVVDLLKRIDAAAQKRFKKSFSEASESQQLALLSAIEEAEKEFGRDDAEHFAFLKHMIVFGYFTSEVGATQELAYLPVPGGFKGSIEYSSVGKAWLVNQ
ncbi:gluconate 2-dehydrogenase subunit 3 family protein [Paraglaciecola chathamensis]|uniref:gluconate 2-dehydrogenase subunit 3 family protein n=1 Tax=Paraglaciecola chathamensis TaxID=368405 RepID=UPI0026F88768|nr:gluconate 2-dehydrogenase subunit 3 family protein [Paraglaciecola chathamensis]MDO6838861.1 gluconate 2-dehydrogenase subunit 3 family protein [Paraglaciecola chathamensis]